MKKGTWTFSEIAVQLGRPGGNTTHLSLSLNLEKVSVPHQEDASKHFYSVLVSLPAFIHFLPSGVLESQQRLNLLRRCTSRVAG